MMTRSKQTLTELRRDIFAAAAMLTAVFVGTAIVMVLL